MQSGLNVPDEVRNEFQALRMKRKHRYVIYKANDAKDAVEIDKIGERSETWDQFKEAMPKNNSR
jgi:cofilin